MVRTFIIDPFSSLSKCSQSCYNKGNNHVLRIILLLSKGGNGGGTGDRLSLCNRASLLAPPRRWPRSNYFPLIWIDGAPTALLAPVLINRHPFTQLFLANIQVLWRDYLHSLCVHGYISALFASGVSSSSSVPEAAAKVTHPSIAHAPIMYRALSRPTDRR